MRQQMCWCDSFTCQPAFEQNTTALLLRRAVLRDRAQPEDLVSDCLQDDGDFGANPPLSYELPGLPGRRLRRWPRSAALGDSDAAKDPVHCPWPVLDPHRWLWDIP
jgi:hypothetical protein